MIKHFGFHTNKETNLKVVGFQIYNLIQIMVQVNITEYPETLREEVFNASRKDYESTPK